MKMIWCGLKIEENHQVLVNQFHGNVRSRTLGCRKIRFVFRDVNWCFNVSWGLKGLIELCWRLGQHQILLSKDSPRTERVNRRISQQTQNISITFMQCWSNFQDVGPTLYKCYKNALLSCQLFTIFCQDIGWGIVQLKIIDRIWLWKFLILFTTQLP